MQDYYYMYMYMKIEMLCNTHREEDVFGKIKFCYEKELKLQYSFREA